MAHLGAADLRALQRVQQLSKHGRRLQNKWRMNDGMLGQVTASSALRGHVAVKGSGRVLRPCIFLGDKVTVVDGAHRGVTGIVRRTSTANGLVWLDDGQSRPKPAANFQQLLLPEARLPERPLRQIRYADVRLVDPRDGQPCDVQWRTLYENVSAADGTAATATSTTDLATMDDTASNITSKPISVRVSSRSGLTIPLQRHRDRKPPHASVSASAGVQRGLGPLDTRRADAEKVTYDIGAEGMDAFECPFPVDLRL